jgi:hypothetical protein
LFVCPNLSQVFTLPYVRQHLQRFNSQERIRLLQRRASLKSAHSPAAAPAAAAVSEEDLTPRQRMELKKEQERQRRQLELQVRATAAAAPAHHTVHDLQLAVGVWGWWLPGQATILLHPADQLHMQLPCQVQP